MLPPFTLLSKGQEKEPDTSNIGGLLMNLPEAGSDDGTSIPTEKDTCTSSPPPTDKEAGRTPPAHHRKEASTSPE